MQQMTHLGATVTTSNFACTLTSCRGNNATTSALLVELQKAINLAGVVRVTVDGIIGKATVDALLRTADVYADKWKSDLDPNLESFLIETGQTTVQRAREIVQNAAAILAALQRGGRRDQGSVSLIQDIANQILATGKPPRQTTSAQMAALLQTLPVTQPANTSTTPTTPADPATQWTTPQPGSGTSALPPLKPSRMGLWLAIGAAVVVVTTAGLFAFTRR